MMLFDEHVAPPPMSRIARTRRRLSVTSSLLTLCIAVGIVVGGLLGGSLSVSVRTFTGYIRQCGAEGLASRCQVESREMIGSWVHTEVSDKVRVLRHERSAVFIDLTFTAWFRVETLSRGPLARLHAPLDATSDHAPELAEQLEAKGGTRILTSGAIIRGESILAAQATMPDGSVELIVQVRR